MKSVIKTVLALSTLATAAMAQVVTPLWVEHMNGEEGVTPANRLPILRKNLGASESNDGTSHQVSFGKLLSYDSTRLLLLVRENGIEEGTATPADAAIAAQYPDASLIWINASNGAPLIPLGHSNAVAHVFGVHPIAITGQGSQNDFFHEFGIAADGTLYSGHKNKLLRWAKALLPDTWSSTPQCAWTEPTVGAADCNGTPLDGSTSGDGNQSMRWREFRVTGLGTNTVLFCGGGTWRQGSQTQIFKTADGTNFYPVAKLNSRDNGTSKNEYALGGQASSVIRYGWDPSRPNLETVYTGHYPGTGYGARPNRYESDPDAPARLITPYSYTPTDSIRILDREETAVASQPAFLWEAAGKDGLPEIPTVDGDKYYDGNWSCNLDGNASLDYIVSYSMPSWNNQYPVINGTNYHKPGWIGVHRLDGSIALNSAWQLPCTEDDIANSDNGGVGNDWGYCGDITLVPDATAPANLKKSKIFWSGGAYGFGVFTIQNVAAAITVPPPTTITLNELDPLLISVGVTGSPNTYQWTKGGVALDGTLTNPDSSLRYPRTVVQGVNKPTLSAPNIRASEGGLYRLTVVNPLSGTISTLNVNVIVNPDTNAPIVLSVGSMDGTTVDVCFNETLDPVTSVDPANYTFVSPSGATVTSAELRKNSKAVRLTVTGLSPATSFSIRVKNVRDYTATAVTAIPLPGQTVAGTVQSALTSTLDIDTAVAGTTYSCNAGEYEVEAGGNDIWGASDTFHFDYKQVTGDFDVRVQVAQVTSPGNRSGIMLRETLNGYSRFNYITFNPGNLLGFHVRETDGTTPVWKNPENNWLGFGPPPNVWMRLKRQGNLTSAFRSTDGFTWTAFGNTTNAIADPAYLGLATAANAGPINTGYTRYASFGNVSVLNISSAGGVLTLSWTGPGVLESAASVEGPYSSVGQSQSNPQIVQATAAKKFFRLKQ